MASPAGFVVVGAGQAGAQVASSLRRDGWSASITVIGDERHLPYQRPPLSKAVLAGLKKSDDIAIRSAADYGDVDLVTGVSVTSLDPAAKVVALGDGSSVPYAGLAICTGARPRRVDLPGSGLAGVHYLRTIEDIEAIRADAELAQRAVIVGAGYTGLEAASVLSTLGVAVTVIEAAPRVLQRVAGALVSEFYARLHAESGVTIRTGEVVTALTGDDRVHGVITGDGSEFPADLVIISVGIIPNVELAAAAGLAVDNGIVVDADCRTSDPTVFAAGDCATRWDALANSHVRYESVPNAIEHGRILSAAACHKPAPAPAEPWFWSDQYDVKLQIAGVSVGHDNAVVRGDPTVGRSFSAWYFRGEKLIAADCVNRPREFIAARRLLNAGTLVDPAVLAQETVNPATLLTAA